jgi:LAGLIDADG-like domain
MLPPPPAWSPEMAYVVGLMATDGNLSRRRWGLSLASNDTDLLETVRRLLHLRNGITPYTDCRCYHIQWRDRRFYNWLISIGLTPAKSLTLGPLEIPDEYFEDFFRGCLDGDGTLLVYTDRYHTAKRESYVYDRLYVALYSASVPFLNWLQGRLRALLGVNGRITGEMKRGRSAWRLHFAKADSIRLDLLRTRRSVSLAQAGEGRAISLSVGLQPAAAHGPAQGGMVIQ